MYKYFLRGYRAFWTSIIALTLIFILVQFPMLNGLNVVVATGSSLFVILLLPHARAVWKSFFNPRMPLLAEFVFSAGVAVLVGFFLFTVFSLIHWVLGLLVAVVVGMMMYGYRMTLVISIRDKF